VVHLTAILLPHVRRSGASPAEALAALLSTGYWDRVTEPAASGASDQRVLDDTRNVLTSSVMVQPLVLKPDSIEVVGGAAGFGPYSIAFSFAEVCGCRGVAGGL
jgi:hypothetical protein